MPGEPQPVELASRITAGVSTDAPASDLETLAERAAVRGGQLVLEGLTGLAGKPGNNRIAAASMMVSLATALTVGGFIIAHSVASSRFERAIEGLVDVLSKKNPEQAQEFHDVERRMHRGE